MTADEYVPSLETLLDHYEELSLTVSRDPEVSKGNRRIAEKSLARARREAKAEAWDECVRAAYAPEGRITHGPNPYHEAGGNDEYR